MSVIRWINSKERPIIFASFLLGVLILAYPYIANFLEFSHDDIAYNYAPFRTWYNLLLGSGIFPLWDPYAGLGRWAEVWTTLPIDVLTPLQLIFPRLSFNELFVLQLILLFSIFFLVFIQMGFEKPLALLGTFLFLLSPATATFIPYYIHVWPYVLYGLATMFILNFIETRKKTHLWGLFFSFLFFGIGGKTELLFVNTTILSLATISFLLNQHPLRTALNLALRILIAMAAPLLINFWSYNLVMVSALESLRPPSGPINWNALADSTFTLFKDGLFICGAVNSILIFFCQYRRYQSNFLDSLATLTLVLTGFFLTPSFNNLPYLVGCGFGFALSLIQKAAPKSRVPWAWRVVSLQFLLIYFGRQSPGEVQEVLLLNQTTIGFKVFIGTFSVYGLITGGTTARLTWFFHSFIALFFMRTIGLVILSHIFGILWLPARDNYIFDFGIAVFSIFGIRRLFEAPEISTKFSVRFIGSIALVFLLALTSKQFPKIQDIQPKQLLSATIRDHVDRWAWEINRGEEPTPPRILTFFHGFARLANIADVREYQSLLSARYGRFSISERLGVPYSDVSSMPAVTGDISERFERLTGPSNSKFKMLRNQRPGVDFYYNFIVQSVPPLSCSHLRLMGINYIEAGSGAFYHGRGSPKNRLYGDAALESPMVDPTIEAIIESCSSRKISLTGRDFWIIDQPLPRAFLVPGFSPGPKLDSILARPPVSQIIKARVLRYEPNRVTAEVNTKEPGTLILTDLYSPHWTARINNKDINIEPVLDLYRGVKVESGHHVVEFRLRYPRKVLTVSVMMLGILLTLGLVFLRPITR